MLIFLLLSLEVESISIESIPPTGPPPIAKGGSAAIYDETTNSIITIGGQKYTDGSTDSEINIFNLTTMKWESAPVITEYVPSMLIYHAMHLRSDRKVLIIGYYYEVYLLDLNGFSWSKAELKGSNIYDCRSFGSTSIVLNGTMYLAIFGGLHSFGFSNTITLIDVNDLTSKTLPNNGSPPSPRNGASISFYNNSFYVYGYSINDLSVYKEKGTELFRYDILQEYWEIVKTGETLPGPRNFHYSVIFNHELYIIYGIRPELSFDYSTIYKLNLKSNNWTLVANNTEHRSYIAATVLIGSKFFFLYGRNVFRFTNSLSFIDLSKSEMVPEYILKSWNSPEERIYHCSFVVNQNMYVFAGYQPKIVNDEFFNDLWAFDLMDEEWFTVSMFGDIPSQRASFGSVVVGGDVLVVFGGIGYDGYYNELFYFQESRKVWTKIQPKNSGPIGRSETCLAYHDNVVYIIGGRNDAGGFNQIWLYSFLTNEYTLHPAKIGGTSQFKINNIVQSKCWVEELENNLKLLIIGGADASAYPNMDLITLNLFSNGSYSLETKPISNMMIQALVGSETSLIKDKNFVIRLGGTVFTVMVLSQVFVFDLSNNKQIPLNLTFNYFGHSAVHYKKSIYVFGGGAANEFYRVTNKLKSHLLKITFDEKDSFRIGCSPGTFLNQCEPCGKGTFYFNETCVECPKGKFNNLVASTSQEQCVPCPFGYFSDKLGATMCLQCESKYNCPIGTSNPKISKNAEGNSSVQPKPYKNNKQIIKDIVGNLWIVSAAVCGLVVLCSLFIGIFWNNIKKIDFFVSNHHNDLGVAIIHRKTSFGGLFSLFFLLISAITITGGILNFHLDNITETQALVPLISLDTSITTSFLRLDFTFYSYGGNCLEKSNCSPKIKIFDDGLKWSSRYIECSFDKNDCKVIANYFTCSTLKKNAEILLSLEEQSSYATGISLNISASSSIPNEISSVFVSFQASSNLLVLKGTTPSIFYYKFTPSVFISESSQWPSQETGFHIWPNQDPQIGSQADQESIKLNHHLKTKVIITESETAMQTQRLINQTWLVFVGTLLGSVFGLMGTVAAIMKFTEIFSEKYERKKLKKLSLEEKIDKRLLLNFEGNLNISRKSSARIAPTVYEISENS